MVELERRYVGDHYQWRLKKLCFFKCRFYQLYLYHIHTHTYIHFSETEHRPLCGITTDDILQYYDSRKPDLQEHKCDNYINVKGYSFIVIYRSISE